MRFISLSLGFIPLILGGCGNPNPPNQPPVYFDVAGYANQQIADLGTRKPLVRKTVRINAGTSRQDTRALNWSRELALFGQADINKPALRNSYHITRPDSLTYQYTLKKSEEKLTVRSLRVQLDSTTRQPRRIEAVLQTDNPLYASERHLWLESGPASGNRWQLRHYKVAGFQKLPYFERNKFLVEGKIIN